MAVCVPIIINIKKGNDLQIFVETIGTLRAKDLRKNLSKLQNGELTPVPLTLLVIKVVLLLWSYGSHKGF